MKFLRSTLDRYVLKAWVKIFVLTALGFPIIAVLIDLTDHLRTLLSKGLTWREIVVSYLYSIPENAYLVMPAAVLFATVFTVGTMGRHSEITAAKASGLSFRRIVFPIFLAGAGAAVLALVVGELSPGASAKQGEIQAGEGPPPTRFRYNFVFRGDAGWVYSVRTLDLQEQQLQHVILERPGSSLEYPGLAITADSATFDSTMSRWRLWHGSSRMIVDQSVYSAATFESMVLSAMTQRPEDLLVAPKATEEMRYAELGRYIEALDRSGNDTNKLKVEQALKLALPGACLIITLFAAPLAVTSPRTGTAFGIAISLGTTVAYLLFIQVSEAIGASGAVNPRFAAWIPNMILFVVGLVLLWRVRT
jgi:lipopolysaccharide export system permease protein